MTLRTPSMQASPSDFAAAFPNSRKVYVEHRLSREPYGSLTLQVPVREVSVSRGDHVVQLYDTSGPQGHDVSKGLPPARRDWILARGDVLQMQPSKISSSEVGMQGSPAAARPGGPRPPTGSR